MIVEIVLALVFIWLFLITVRVYNLTQMVIEINAALGEQTKLNDLQITLNDVLLSKPAATAANPFYTCIGCGCTDFDACEPACNWCVVDAEQRLGVCSNPDCDRYIEQFCAGDLTISDKAQARIAERLAFGGPG